MLQNSEFQAIDKVKQMIPFVPFTTEEGTLWGKTSCFPKQLLTRDLHSQILFPIPFPEPISPFFVQSCACLSTAK